MSTTIFGELHATLSFQGSERKGSRETGVKFCVVCQISELLLASKRKGLELHRKSSAVGAYFSDGFAFGI